jgi:transcription elongation GreA/GreB family factor
VSSAPDKARVIEAFRRAVGADLEASSRIVSDARDEATGSESRAENQYDTRATEASYLAAGQGQRLLALRALHGWLEQLDPEHTPDRVGLGALVALRRGPAAEWLLLGPDGGGSVRVDAVDVRLVSARSPTGAALAGLQASESAEIETPRGPVEVEVVEVR